MSVLSDILKEVDYKTSRSGGAGGQHVNKVETKVSIIWNVQDSKVLQDWQKDRVSKQLANRIDSNGNLILHAQESRSQQRNKTIVSNRLIELVENSLKERKKRKRTKKSRAQEEKRLKVKRIKSEHKQNRKRVKW